MTNLKTFLWNITLILLTLAVIIFGFRGWFLKDRVDNLVHSIQSDETGTDVALLETVNRLEESLADQAAFNFRLSKDPLDLTRVVMNLSFMDNPEFYAQQHERKPRVSSTILAEGGFGVPVAIIRLKGRDLVVRVGEIFDDGKYEVLEITRGAVKVRTGGRVKTLPLEEEMTKRKADQNQL